MNAPHEPPDPLLQMLAEEAAELPAHAAMAARQSNARRQRTRQRLALAASVCLCGVSAWVLIPSLVQDNPTVTVNPAAPPTLTPAAGPPGPREMASIQLQEQGEPLSQPPPSGLDQDQMAFVQAARDLPMLLVRDASGKVTRIHLVEC
jgi:hypothetical protein